LCCTSRFSNKYTRRNKNLVICNRRDFRAWSADRDGADVGSNNNNARFNPRGAAQQGASRPPNNYPGGWGQSATLPRQWGAENHMGGDQRGGWDNGFGSGGGGRFVDYCALGNVLQFNQFK